MRKHRAPSLICCALGLFSSDEWRRGVRETWGHSGVHQATCLGLRVAQNWAFQSTSAGRRGPGRSPAVPCSSRGLVAYRGALSAS